MALRALPDGYVDLTRARVRLLARRELAGALVDAGFLDGRPLERLAAPRMHVGGGRHPLLALEVPGVDGMLVGKRLQRGGALGALPRALGALRRTNRAFAEILVTETLRQAGVPVVAIVAARIVRPPFVDAVGRIELFSMHAPDARDLATFLASPTDRRLRARALAAVGRAIASMHAAGVIHEDLNLRNVLVRSDGTALLLDLGDSTVRDRSDGDAARNLARLWRSAVKIGLAETGAITRADVVRVLRAYSGSDWKPVLRDAAAAYARTAALHRVAWGVAGRGDKARGARVDSH